MQAKWMENLVPTHKLFHTVYTIYPLLYFFTVLLHYLK